jgi:hypothetical protein
MFHIDKRARTAQSFRHTIAFTAADTLPQLALAQTLTVSNGCRQPRHESGRPRYAGRGIGSNGARRRRDDGTNLVGMAGRCARRHRRHLRRAADCDLGTWPLRCLGETSGYERYRR